MTKGNLVAVLSPNEWEAAQAARAVAAETRWTDWSGLPGSDNLTKALRAHSWGAPAGGRGDAAKADGVLLSQEARAVSERGFGVLEVADVSLGFAEVLRFEAIDGKYVVALAESGSRSTARPNKTRSDCQSGTRAIVRCPKKSTRSSADTATTRFRTSGSKRLDTPNAANGRRNKASQSSDAPNTENDRYRTATR